MQRKIEINFGKADGLPRKRRSLIGGNHRHSYSCFNARFTFKLNLDFGNDVSMHSTRWSMNLLTGSHMLNLVQRCFDFLIWY